MLPVAWAAVDGIEDINAIMARCNAVLCTDECFICHFANEHLDAAPFMAYPALNKLDLFTPASRSTFAAYKKNLLNRTRPPNYAEDMAWSCLFIQKLLQGEAPSPSITAICPTSFESDRVSPVQVASAAHVGSSLDCKVCTC